MLASRPCTPRVTRAAGQGAERTRDERPARRSGSGAGSDHDPAGWRRGRCRRPGPVAELIRWAGGSPAPVLALDVPSGLDATTGRVSEAQVHATATLTLALPKRGLATAAGVGAAGGRHLADIGVPSEVYRRHPLALEVPLVFADADLVRLR